MTAELSSIRFPTKKNFSAWVASHVIQSLSPTCQPRTSFATVKFVKIRVMNGDPVVNVVAAKTHDRKSSDFCKVNVVPV
jgi:hypothetical protein